jgi:predicted Zn-dependent protease
MNKNAILRISVGIILIGLIAWAISCAVNPVTGKKEFMLMTESDEIALGKQSDQEVSQSYGIYEDAELNAYVNQIGQRMAKLSHRPNLTYSFKVLDTPVINAFAVPGGYVYVTRGILSYMNNEAELAGVVGHEIGHVTARHTAQQYSRTQLAQLGLGVGAILSEKFRQYAGLAQFGASMLFLRFSRDNERQSDNLGVEYSTRAGYDANEMANFFETLERMNPGSDQSGLPGWFSTHPNPADRYNTVRKEAQIWQKKLALQNLAVEQQTYLKEIDGIVFGEDPRQGYVEGNTFYHPQLKFTFPVPANWQVNNTPAQVQISPEKQDAAILFSLDNNASPALAAQEFIKGTNAVVQSSDAIRVNGMTAQRVVADVASDQGNIRVMSYFIEKDNSVYAFHGFSVVESYPTYNASFANTMGQFNRLTDAKKINVQASHLQIRTASASGNARTVLKSMGVADDKLEEMALLNGVRLEDAMPSNKLIKLVTK